MSAELTFDKLREIMREAPDAVLNRYVGPLNAAAVEFELNTAPRWCALLATLAHESGELRWQHEFASGAAYDDREDLGNTLPEAIAVAKVHGTTPGRFYRGHGPAMITGYKNHLACGMALGLNLVDEPSMLEHPTPGARSACWFFRNAKLRDDSVVDLTPYADALEFRTVSLAWNRGLLESEHDPLHWEERQRYFMRARIAFAI